MTYNPETGAIERDGVRVDYLTKTGYHYVTFNGRRTQAHRVAVFLMTGEWPIRPAREVDHINGERSDNRWANLRVCTRRQNGKNMRLRKDNTSGYIGVHQRKSTGRFLAYTRDAAGKRLYLGHYATAQDAARAHDEAARRLNGEYAALNYA